MLLTEMICSSKKKNSLIHWLKISFRTLKNQMIL